MKLVKEYCEGKRDIIPQIIHNVNTFDYVVIKIVAAATVV